jgi:hypothetical protein
MNLNISNEDFVNTIKDYLYKIKMCGNCDRSFSTAKGSHFRMSIEGNYFFRLGYNVTSKAQLKALTGFDYDNDKLICKKSPRTRAFPKLPTYYTDNTDVVPSGYIYVVDGVMFYRPSRSDFIFPCVKDDKIIGTNLEVK